MRGPVALHTAVLLPPGADAKAEQAHPSGVQLKRQGAPVADSFRALHALRDMDWRCHDRMLANVDPNGHLNARCYVRHSGPVACHSCGLASHLEILQTFELLLPSILLGRRIFQYNKMAQLRRRRRE